MFDDPIIDEVREVRDQIAARFGYDVKAIGAYYQLQQRQNNIPVVSRQPRPPELIEPLTTVNQSQVVDAAARVNDLVVPAGNRLEALKGNQAGRHSIRVNDQYRVTFRWESGHAYEVCVEDYH